MTEYLVENYVGALAADITATALSLTLATNPGTAVPATGDFRLRLSDVAQTVEETIWVTTRAGAVLSWPDVAHRGTEDPTGIRPARAWPAATTIVEAVPTKDGLEAAFGAARTSSLRGRGTYTIGKGANFAVDGKYCAVSRYSAVELFPYSDPALVIQQAADTLHGLSLGGSIDIPELFTCNSCIDITGDGVQLISTGWAKEGDEPPAGLLLNTALPDPYSGGGMGTTPFITFHGASCGGTSVHVDAQNRARKAGWVVPQGTGGNPNAGNRTHLDSMTFLNGTEYGLDWEGSDGHIGGITQIRMGVGGDGTHGVSAFRNTGGNLNLSGSTHIHGSGVGASGRVAIFTAHMLKCNGVHFEAGSASTNAYNVEVSTKKAIFAGCIFGRVDQGGELYLSGTSGASLAACQFASEDLDAAATYNMIRVDGSGRLRMAACDVFATGAGGDNLWNYALSKAANARVRIGLSSLIGGQANFYDNATNLVTRGVEYNETALADLG